MEKMLSICPLPGKFVDEPIGIRELGGNSARRSSPKFQGNTLAVLKSM